MSTRALLLTAAVGLVALGAGCPGQTTVRLGPISVGPFAPAEPGVDAEDVWLPFDVDEQTQVVLGARLYRPSHADVTGPAVLLLPGGGNVSRNGTRPGDGVTLYDAPIDVTDAWARAIALRGGLAFAWDKRTCAPKDDPLCKQNPTTDIDAEGPAALARDVDAACAFVENVPGFDGRVVLWAHGQATSVALASSCAQRASALVLVAPIPRRIDEVLVETLTYREELARKRAKKQKAASEREALLRDADKLKNSAASTAAMFESMQKGQFAEDARVRGATLAFWRSWIELTDGTEDAVKKATAPRLVVQGQWDLQFTLQDRKRVRGWGGQDGVTYLQIPRGDHHLVSDGALSEDTVKAVLDALDAALAPPAQTL
jgi:hypothetical protein